MATSVKYIRGQVRFGKVYYETFAKNETENKADAKRFTLKQCHTWLWKMRKQAPNGNWGYWPCSD